MTTVTNPPVVPKKPPKGGVNMFGPHPSMVSVPTHSSPSIKPPSPSIKPPSNSALINPEITPLPDVVRVSSNCSEKPTKNSAPTNFPHKQGSFSKDNYFTTDMSSSDGLGYLDSNDPYLMQSVVPKNMLLPPTIEDRRSSLKKVEVNDFSPPEPNFGRSLAHKSGIDTISKMMEEEITYLRNWKRYLEDRTKIETTYYKTLQDLHEKHSINSPLSQPDIGRETFVTFPSFIDTSQQYIDTIAQSITTLNKETIPSILSLIKSKKSVKELYITQSRNLEKERHTYTRKMEESRRHYCDLHKEVDNAKSMYSTAMVRGAKQDKMKKSFLTKSREMVEAHNSYVLALRACDVYEQWHHESLLPVLLNTFQRILMLQTDYYSSFYDNLVTTLHQKLDPNSILIRQLIGLGGPLNGDVEYLQVIREKGEEPTRRTPLLYDKNLPKHQFIDILENQLIIQNREVTCKLKADLQLANEEHQRNKQSKHTELTYMDKAITSTQGGHKPISAYPFDINELCRNFASIMLEMQMESYKQDICLIQLKLVEGVLGATDGVDLDDNTILDRAFPQRAQHGRTMGSTASIDVSKNPIKRGGSFTESPRDKPPLVHRPTTPPEPMNPGRGTADIPIELEAWYFGEISRDEAEKLLLYDGDYLVRYSSGQKGFVISTKFKGATKHFVVKKENGLYMFNKQGFLSIRCLLEHQQAEKQPLIGEFYLIRAITREGDKWEITEKDLDIMDRIGKGNFGYVYKGYMRSRGSHVAIKMCKSDALTDQDEFLREAEILKQYRHHNIVEFIGVSQQAESIYIIMELMSGGDFLTFLRNKSIREKKYILSNMILDVAGGMDYLSSKDCVHRDLAARNCLIGEGKCVKISDFGMSRQLSEGEYQMSTVNKPLPIKWTAPEALHKGLYTCQSDVWSYGILLWETFSSGSTPYPGMDSKTAIEKLETGYRLPAPSGTPQPIYAMMLQCWEYNPQTRPRFSEIHSTLKSISHDLRAKNI
ncbi:Tyrosine-protein kinase Fer isoform X1 [Oopsacas minuta]|uniref:Tyrosine-protein kinase n=1 Tax=Oopsacas minuta TaxID=111878 RepID=A0AAV7JDZ5_9METZ|nr:Tyrosine-protein kinase Fer isoform X1 [Oopsacas minuta]